ncbi:hypothetical protein CPB85DRAFT_370182 [Mucidula mucida]|nr:hypothetical protein CPB85DRAFT_370182 [Mucidula mucida]
MPHSPSTGLIPAIHLCIAVFKEKNCHADFQPKLIERLKENFEYGNVCHEPRIIIEIRRLANDTPICDMQPDWDNLCLTANWKMMLSEFFAEEKAYKSVLDARLETLKSTLASMRDNPSVVLGDSLKSIFQSLTSSDADARKQVRSRRIRRHVWEQDHIEWTDTDTHGYQAVKAARSNLGWAEFSDDEEEEPEGGSRLEEQVFDDYEEGDGDEDDWEGVEDEDDDEEGDGGEEEKERGVQEDNERRTKRRTEGPAPPRRNKTPASLPPDQSTGPGPAPAGFVFTFKAPPSV